MKSTIRINTTLSWQITRTKSTWLAECDSLGLVLEDDSLDSLRSMINEAIQLLFEDLLADRELKEFFRDRGWSLSSDNIYRDNVVFHVPTELLIRDLSNSIH